MTKSTDWIDRGLYPFESHWHEVSGGRLHYVDEGSGRPILFLHGNPTWSFMYREAIRVLSDRHRCIAPDYLGFGLSDKPGNFDYRPWQHASHVLGLIESLRLRDFHLVVHDWGGPIGLSVAQDVVGRVHSLTVLNTWMWPMTSSLRAQLFSRVLGSFLGRYLIKRWALFEKWLMPQGVQQRDQFDGAVHDHYVQPFDEPDSRTGIWRFPADILGAREWLGNLWQNRRVLRDLPVLLCWGLKDPAFNSRDLERWKRVFNRHSVHTYDDASHYVMEDRGTDVATQIRRFLAS